MTETVFETFRKQALAEFDAQVAQRAEEIRTRMRAAGCTAEEIDVHLASFKPGLEEQRRGIGHLVMSSMIKAGVSLEVSADVLL